jgi:quercetin dioxygenase-like cupin family protein
MDQGELEMMRVLHKSWGVKTELFKNDLCEVSVLQLNAGQRCSWHRHRSKWNQFYVIEGSLTIKTEDGETKVNQGQVFTTNPLQWHEFQTPDSQALVQEIMYVKYECEDIERRIKGGSLAVTVIESTVCDHDWEDMTQPGIGAHWSRCRKCAENKFVPKCSNQTLYETLHKEYDPTCSENKIGGGYA